MIKAVDCDNEHLYVFRDQRSLPKEKQTYVKGFFPGMTVQQRCDDEAQRIEERNGRVYQVNAVGTVRRITLEECCTEIGNILPPGETDERKARNIRLLDMTPSEKLRHLGWLPTRYREEYYIYLIRHRLGEEVAEAVLGNQEKELKQVEVEAKVESKTPAPIVEEEPQEVAVECSTT